MPSRREFLRSAGRLLLLGGLVAGGGRLATRKKRAASSGTCATKTGVCRACPILAPCRHPTAISYKERRDGSS